MRIVDEIIEVFETIGLFIERFTGLSVIIAVIIVCIVYGIFW